MPEPLQLSALQALKDLEEFHGKPLTKEGRVFYVQELSRYPAEILSAALRRWKRKNSPSVRFPAVTDLQVLIEEARSSVWNQTKQRENRYPLSEPTVRLDPEYARACWSLVMTSARGTWDEMVVAMKQLDSDYPGHGWAAASDRARMSPPPLPKPREELKTPTAAIWEPKPQDVEEARRTALLKQVLELVAEGQRDA